MDKNQANQKISILVYDNDGGVVGIADQITAEISKDGSSFVSITDTNPTEVGDGIYVFDVTQEESNCDLFILVPNVPSGYYTSPTIDYVTDIQKNQADQKIAIYAYDINGDVIGDSNNISASISQDGETSVPLNDPHPDEIGYGVYTFDITQEESNCDLMIITPESSTGATIDPVSMYLNEITIEEINVESFNPTSAYLSGGAEINISGTFGSEGNVYIDGQTLLNAYWSTTFLSGTTREVYDDETVKGYIINGDNQVYAFDFTYVNNPVIDVYTSFSSLPSDTYFKKCTDNYDSERLLYDLLVTEAYNQAGTCMTYYVIDYDTTKDKLFGEDTDRTVLRSFDIMAHGELPREEQLWSKFGIEGLDNFQIYVAKRHFTAASSQDSYDATVPRIGDMIYMDHNNRTYDVIDVGQEDEMFLQGKHTWIITLSPHQDTHIALSADTSATMGDISAATDQTSDEYDISSYIENEVSAVEFDTSGDSGDAPSTVWGDW